MKRAIYIIAGLLLALPFYGGTQQLQRIAKPPSNEIYDMLIDHKGFLWIAHSLGISRYDGVSFTSFTSVHQSAVGASGLQEDRYGRIWFYNFNGQVFYIQNEKMEYLKAYDYQNSMNFPVMAILGDELAITSIKGLFLCNLKTLKSRTEIVKNDTIKWGIQSVCALNNRLLLHTSDYTRSIWLTYTPAEGVREIYGEDSVFFGKTTYNAVLARQSFFDTAILVGRNINTAYGITLSNDKLKLVFKKNAPAYINTVNVLNDRVWINSRTASFTLSGRDTISNRNITCILPDAEGNTWYSSLVEGLLVKNKNQVWQRINLPVLAPGDLVQCMLHDDNDNFIACSRQGHIIAKKGNEHEYAVISSVSTTFGAPESIQQIDPDKFFIPTSRQLFMLNKKQKRLFFADSNNIKSFAVEGGNLLLATSFGLLIKPNRLLDKQSKDSFFVTSETKQLPSGNLIYKTQRCRAVLFDSVSKQTYVAFTSGLVRIKNGIAKPLLYNNQLPMYVSAMVISDNKIYASTFNNGLFIINNDSIIKVKNDTESPMDAITKLKNCRHHIWLFRTNDIQLLDKRTGQLINVPSLPVTISDILDADEDSSNIYLATANGLFSLPVGASVQENKKPITLIYALVNNRDTLFASNNTLKNNENNLLLRLAIPIYDNAGKVHFKYQLANDGADTGWYYTHDAQRDIQFNALRPGNYTFTAIAIKDNEVISTNPLVYQFTIKPPWYNTWPFYVLVALIIISITIAIQQNRLRQILKIERVRRKIASDLHDDIGSTLSSINVYSEIAKKEDDNKEYINTIQQNTVSIINNLDDLVWNINPKNDVFENMIARMRHFAEPLLAEKHIDCIFNIDADNLHASITPDARTNIYLLFKEAVNNTVKHSGCTTCTINILQRGKSLTLTVADNGKGFDSTLISKHRNGLHNMRQRAADIKGILTINSAPGQGTVVTITSHIN